MIIALPLFVCLIGLALFFIAKEKWSTVGFAMFQIGLLVSLLHRDEIIHLIVK